MKKILIGLLLVMSLAVPAAAAEIKAPSVPGSGAERMPQNTDSFGESLLELLENSLELIHPELEDALESASGVLCSALLISVLPLISKKIHGVASFVGAAVIAAAMFRQTNAMIQCASETVWEICEYGKLLCPVLTTALAAQGGISSSTVLYTGTTVFITLLSSLVSGMMVPMVYLFLAFSTAHCAMGNEVLMRFSDAIKHVLSWSLKTLLVVFTTYMSITGIVSGTTDAAALKAAKITISSAVPVVGSILSDASDSVLVSMGILKNAAGIYGILAVLAVFMGPFIKIGVQYLVLKITSMLCGLFSSKNISALVEDFSTAMGLLLAMAASGCIMVLISTVCYLKGIG